MLGYVHYFNRYFGVWSSVAGYNYNLEYQTKQSAFTLQVFIC